MFLSFFLDLPALCRAAASDLVTGFFTVALTVANGFFTATLAMASGFFTVSLAMASGFFTVALADCFLKTFLGLGLVESSLDPETGVSAVELAQVLNQDIASVSSPLNNVHHLDCHLCHVLIPIIMINNLPMFLAIMSPVAMSLKFLYLNGSHIHMTCHAFV
jgi:hypothetical protein